MLLQLSVIYVLNLDYSLNEKQLMVFFLLSVFSLIATVWAGVGWMRKIRTLDIPKAVSGVAERYYLLSITSSLVAPVFGCIIIAFLLATYNPKLSASERERDLIERENYIQKLNQDIEAIKSNPPQPPPNDLLRMLGLSETQQKRVQACTAQYGEYYVKRSMQPPDGPEMQNYIERCAGLRMP